MIAEGTRGILGRLPRSAEHYKFQAGPHSPRQLAHLLLASFLLCTRCYCNFFLLFGKGSKASSVMCWFKRVFFFFNFLSPRSLSVIKELCKWNAKGMLPVRLPPPPLNTQDMHCTAMHFCWHIFLAWMCLLGDCSWKPAPQLNGTKADRGTTSQVS